MAAAEHSLQRSNSGSSSAGGNDAIKGDKMASGEWDEGAFLRAYVRL